MTPTEGDPETPGSVDDGKAQRRRRQRRLADAAKAPLLADIATAAARLGLEPEALRARARRAQTVERGETIARLGAGVVAYKFGRTWRFRFNEP